MSQRLAEPSVMQIQHANFGGQRRVRREIPLGAGIWGTRDEMVGVMMHALEMQWNLAPFLDCLDVITTLLVKKCTTLDLTWRLLERVADNWTSIGSQAMCQKDAETGVLQIQCASFGALGRLGA